MTTTNHTASAEFYIGDTMEFIKVEHVPFTWDHSKDRDTSALLVVATYIGDHNLTNGQPIIAKWVETSAALEEA
jgi:hypothetical protein